LDYYLKGSELSRSHYIASLIYLYILSFDSHKNLQHLADSPVVLAVETKYYSAEIPLRVAQLSSSAERDGASGTLGALGTSEGVLLLLPHRSAEAEGAVRRAFERLHAAASHSSTASEQLRIAVTVRVCSPVPPFIHRYQIYIFSLTLWFAIWLMMTVACGGGRGAGW
jgi:hypothetical protein